MDRYWIHHLALYTNVEDMEEIKTCDTMLID